MSTSDGTVLGATKVVDHGADSDRFNLVFLSDGYQSTEMAQFETDVDDFLAYFFSIAPYNDLEIQCAFNVYRVDVTSTDSGADNPAPCGSSAPVDTYFDANFCESDLARLMGVNDQLVRDTLDAEVPNWDQAVVLVNSSLRGGAGGDIAIASTGGFDWMDVIIHEMSHSAFDLADEYEYWSGCGIDTDRDNHPGPEPAEPNVTIDSNRATIKWGGLIAAATPMPTTSNPDCTLCDQQGSPVATGTVGAFEGAHYYHCDSYRPEFDCMMRNTGVPFCAVCIGQIRSVLAPFTSPTTVTLDTPSAIFNDVPEGIEAPASAVFTIDSCLELTFEIISGPAVLSGPPATTFDTPLGNVFVSSTLLNPRQLNIWITYRGTTDGDTATGTMTVRCVETGADYVIPISANTVGRPTVATVLVLDKSGSMNLASGIPGYDRIDVLHYSAPPFVDLLGENDAIGIASFDHDAYTDMAVTGPLAAPSTAEPDRQAAKDAIAAHTPNPMGNTAIGDGIERASDLLAPLTGYDEKATIVLTDGHETAAKYISEVSSLINERVFAIGLGTADQIQPSALNAISNGTGGYMLMTGEIGDSEYFRLSKYYLQILTGVTNTDIVVDPEGYLQPDVPHRIPFELNETDIYTDVILLSPGKDMIEFTVETPDGQVIDPALAAASAGMNIVYGTGTNYYRLSLPALVGGASLRSGLWHAVLQTDRPYLHKYISSLDSYPHLMKGAEAHGIRYSLSVHAYSNLRMQTRVESSSQVPGATLTLRVSLTEYGLPVDGRATVRADLERPDKTTAVLGLAEVSPGVFETSITASQAGIYTFLARATGKTLRYRPFMREQVATGAVWRGGDDPLPQDPPDRVNDTLCQLLYCLFNDKVLTEQYQKHLEEMGINVKALRKCLQTVCRDKRK